MHILIRPQKLRIPVLALVAFLIASGCARTPQQKEAKFLENGKKYMLRKDYARAALEFRNAVRVMPKDAEAYYQLGLSELNGGRLSAGVAALKKATELNPQHAGAQVKLAELMALSGIRDIATDGEKRMEDVLRSSPDNIDALDALALNEFQLGKWQDAQMHLMQALDKFPQSVDSAVALARLDLARGDLKGAELVLTKLVTEAPQSPEARTALGQLYLLARQPAQAEPEFRAALKIKPDFPLALLGLASTQVRLGQKEQAEQTYRTLSALPDGQYKNIYPMYLFDEGKHDSSIKEFERLARQDPADRGTRTKLVAAYLQTKRLQDAERVLRAALKENPKDLDALVQRSQVLLQAGKDAEAEGDLNQVLRYKPDAARAHYLLAHVYRARQDSGRERQELNEALRLEPELLQARIELAQALIETNSGKTALTILDATPDQQKNRLGVLIERVWALLAMNADTEARKYVDHGLKFMRVPDLLTQDSFLKFRGKDYAGAIAAAKEALAKDPENVKALRLMASGYLAQKQPAAARQALQEHAGQHPKSEAIEQFLGEWLLASGDFEQARAALAAAKAANPNSAGLNMALARLAISEGKLDEGRKILSEIASSNGANSEAHLWLGTLEVKAGDHSAAIEEFRKALVVDDRNVLALNNLAYLLAKFGNTDEALKFAQRACELAPENADVQGTLGWVLYRKGLYEAALKYLQEAVKRDGESSTENAAIRKYYLSEAYLKLGDRQSGMQALQAAIKIKPDVAQIETRN